MIELRDVHKTYRLGGTDVRALCGVSLDIVQGEFVAIIGPSGSGKSTLMHVLGLLDRPDRGMYRLRGEDVSKFTDDELATLRAGFVGFVFQQFNLLARTTARENVSLPLIYAVPGKASDPAEVLGRVGLGERMDHAPNELSGGEQQRVAIARALINRPLVLMADEPTGNLDTERSRDIMRLLRDLHASGLTIIVVTHDPEVAENADRVIKIRDGQIESDTGAHTAVESVSTAASLQPMHRRRAWNPVRSLHETMALFRQAGRSLGANKTRTLLSMLGVLIGVGAVIAVMALGRGAKMAVEDRISSLGANLLIVRPDWRRSRTVSTGADAVSRLTLDDARAVAYEAPGIVLASPVVRGSAQVTYGGKNWRTSIYGVMPSYANMKEMQPYYGRFFTEEEVEQRARVAVVGLTVVRELFGENNPVGRIIRINRVNFEVIGVLPEKGASFHRDENDQIIMPVTTAMRRLLGKNYIDHIEMQAASSDLLGLAETGAVKLLKARQRIPKEDEDAFRVHNLADIRETIEATSDTLAVLLSSIGAISLLVGGIGIMNIMLVSVAERTREIGVRKAVGAKRTDIMAQFLVESLAVSVLGGLIGIALGWTASYIMSKTAGWAVAVTPRTVLVAFGFSAVVGIVFGLWPAWKASRLEPIEALRYE